jgi:hypothetical protein
LASQGQIDWKAPGTTRRYSLLPREQWGRSSAYILEQFAQRGLNKIGDFQAYKWPQGSTVTGESACKAKPKVNVNLIMARAVESIAGTIVHERIHTFCQRHTCNCPENNQCDMAYQSGSLVRVITLYRANNSKPVSLRRYKMCKALRNELKAQQIAQ